MEDNGKGEVDKENSCCYQMVYPPLEPPMKKLFLRWVIMTLAPCIAAICAALGGCPGGGGFNVEGKQVSMYINT